MIKILQILQKTDLLYPVKNIMIKEPKYDGNKHE